MNTPPKKNRFPFRLRPFAWAAAILVAGVLCAGLLVVRADRQLREELLDRTQLVAGAVEIALVEGPVTDRWGTWISALVPLTAPQTGDLVAVLGMDIDARDWKWDVAGRASLPVGLVLLLIMIGLATAVFPFRRAEASPQPVLRRLLPGLTALLLLLLGGGYGGLVRIQENQLREFSLLMKQEAHGDLEQLLAEQARGLEAVQVPLLRDAELIAALKAGDRVRLLERSKPLFDELNARYEGTHFYFSDAQRVCLLRVHNPEKHGDRFDRYTALEAERTGQVASGIELGPLGTFTLRVVRPVFEEGQLLGYLELGKEIEDVLNSIVTAEGVEKILAIRKDALDRTRWEAGMGMLGRDADWDRLPDHAVIYASIAFHAEAERLIGFDEHDHADAPSEIRFDGKVWWTVTQHVADVSGHEVGELLLLRDVTEMKTAQRRLMMAAGMGALVLLGTLLAMIVVMLRRTDASILAQQRVLRESEEHLSATLRSIGDGVIACDGEGRVTSLNRVAETLTGWTTAEAVGRPLEEVFRIINAGTRETAENPVTRALAEGVIVGLANHTALIARDGTEHQIADSCAPILDAAGTATGAILVFRDVTEEYRQREELRNSEKILRDIMESTLSGFWDWNLVDNTEYLSPTFKQMFGYEDHEMESSPEAWQRIIFPEDLPGVLEVFDRHVKSRGRDPFYSEIRYRHRDGSTVWVICAGRVIKWADDGTAIRMAGCHVDITDRKQAETYREMGREILQILNEPGDLQASIERVIAALKTRTGVDAVGLRLQDGEDFPYLAQDGFPADFLQTENTLLERGKDGGVCRDKNGNACLECTCGLVISGKTDPSNPLFTKRGSSWINDSFPLLDLPSDQDPRLHPRNQCVHHGYASVALIPVRTRERVVGLIQLNDKRKDRFTLETIEILEGIATHIGSALMRKQIEEKLHKNVNQLTRINKLMMGREMRVLELKKEINALRKQAEREPSYTAVEGKE